MNDPLISDVIAIRTRLQTVQSSLTKEFGIKDPSFNKVTSADLLNKYKTWEESKKHQFLVTLGGPMNYEKTKRYFTFLFHKNKIN